MCSCCRSSQRSELRSRIYGSYGRGQGSPVPATLDGLRPRAAYLRRLIRRHFPADRNAAILDLGAGHGAILYFARQAGYRNVTGVDTSPEQVDAARRLGIEGVRQGDLFGELRARPAASQDVVITFDVLEHFERQELLPFADEVYRVLRHGGRWIIHAPNGDSPFCGRSRYNDLTHELAFTANSLAQLFEASGFRPYASFDDTPAVHGVRSAVRYLIWHVLRALMRLYLAAETGSPGSGILSQNFLTVAHKPGPDE